MYCTNELYFLNNYILYHKNKTDIIEIKLIYPVFFLDLYLIHNIFENKKDTFFLAFLVQKILN